MIVGMIILVAHELSWNVQVCTDLGWVLRPETILDGLPDDRIEARHLLQNGSVRFHIHVLGNITLDQAHGNLDALRDVNLRVEGAVARGILTQDLVKDLKESLDLVIEHQEVFMRILPKVVSEVRIVRSVPRVD